jgi:hypothetical protein
VLRNATAALAPLGIGDKSRIENGIMQDAVNQNGESAIVRDIGNGAHPIIRPRDACANSCAYRIAATEFHRKTRHCPQTAMTSSSFMPRQNARRDF